MNRSGELLRARLPYTAWRAGEHELLKAWDDRVTWEPPACVGQVRNG